MMRGFALALLMCTAAAFGEQKAAQVSAQPGTYRVDGVVVNAVSGEAVAGARVMLSPAINARLRAPIRPGRVNQTSETREIRSAADGSFAFDHLPAGRYSLSAVRRGFVQQAFDEHEQFSSAIVVGADKTSTGLRFQLLPDASISGTVVDDHNEAVMNAMVSLFRDGIQQGKQRVYRAGETMSNDLGEYHFAHLRPGKYYVAVAATPWYAQNVSGYGAGGGTVSSLRSGVGARPPGYNPALDVAYPITFYPGVTDSADAEPITLTPAQHEDADFTLTAVPALHVRVHIAGDNPQQNVFASVTRQVFGTNEMSGGMRSINYGQGLTELSGLTPGHYFLQLHEMGNGRGPQTLVQRDIDITGDTEINSLDVPAGVALTGTARFEGPGPEGDARVALRRAGMQPIMMRLNEKGQFSSEQPITPGKYEIFFPSPNYQITHISVTGAKLDGQSIQVGGDDVHLGLDIAKASARIEGTALKSGTPLAGAMIVLVPQDMSRPMLYRRDQSDSDGTFTLGAVPPGTYTLVAIEDGWQLEWADPNVIRQFVAGGERVQVAMDGDYHVDAKVQRMPSEAKAAE